jgi:DNA topoisomerase-1
VAPSAPFTSGQTAPGNKVCELYLATDEDREGEPSAGTCSRYLKPKVPVKRMVFHEITKSAIDHAVANPRGLDYGLVDAAETRRLLDRLYGYEVSPVLWKKVNRASPRAACRARRCALIVERERERMRVRHRRLLGHRPALGHR